MIGKELPVATVRQAEIGQKAVSRDRFVEQGLCAVLSEVSLAQT